MIEPLHDYLLAEAEKADDKTAGGFYLPERAQEKPQSAIVTAIGPSVIGIKVGDIIISKSYAATEVKVENKEFLLIKFEDVIAKVTNE